MKIEFSVSKATGIASEIGVFLSKVKNIGEDRNIIKLVAKNERLFFISNKDEASLVVSKKVIVKESGVVFINGQMLSRFLSKFPKNKEGVVVLEKVDSVLKINYRKMDYSLDLSAESSFSKQKKVNLEAQITISSKAFLNASDRIVNFCDKNGHVDITRGVYMKLESGELILVGMDGYKMAIGKSKIDFDGSVNGIVPVDAFAYAVSQLKKFSEKKFSLGFTSKHIIFKIGSFSLLARLITRDYVDYKQIFPADSGVSVSLESKNLVSILSRMSLMVSREMNSMLKIKLDPQNNEIIFSTASEFGKAKEALKVNYKDSGSKISEALAFNVSYFENILRIFSGRLELEFYGPSKPVVFRGEGTYKKALLLPINKN